ncbi:type IV pilus twitching motility protein PilT [Virgibacillus proomii]|uniref:type IV pilus twitching motility protein PilT n=1 Tax=Virgibacillus sp. TaxID=1872700 RepID=UPI0017A9F9DC|nr:MULTISPECIES: type IV pilus twitching motility protein PilT [Virgibacillus]MBU5265688.1 type IV pilus twitching motility protein PilT [Virgibacillus proomii]NWO15172.1 type IV pilus twitching motility protein PilT [Virgibacillus sp.]
MKVQLDINELLKAAVNNYASDVHISVGCPPVFRINGVLTSFGERRLTNTNIVEMAKQMLSPKQWETFLKEGELDASYEITDVGRFRLNVYYQKQQVSFVARIIPNDIPSLEELNMPAILKGLALRPHGLILVTGPTGSGKTTTLAAMVDYINHHNAKHIVTLEDPIEYIHQHSQSIIHQREVGVDTKSFAKGLRASLRQDPDILLVGEMRDLETISTAITAAETGHLVLATLHTNSAVQTINRIIDVFPPHQQGQIRVQLADVLEGILSQRLFKSMDHRGRIAATEILINHPSIANLIRSDKVEQIENVIQTSRCMGMHTLQMSINQLLQANKITNEEAKSYLSRSGVM